MSPDEIVGWILVWGAGALLILGFVAVATHKDDPVMTADDLTPATDPVHDAAFDRHVEESLRVALGERMYDRLVCDEIEAAESGREWGAR